MNPLNELPIKVGEVKKLLILAKEMNIDVSTSKVLINNAVVAGNERDIDKAIRLLNEGKVEIERKLKYTILSLLELLEKVAEFERNSGKKVVELEKDIIAAKKFLEMGEFQNAHHIINRQEQTLPNYIANEMKKAKVTLRELKMNKADITIPVAQLKDTNKHITVGNYWAALVPLINFLNIANDTIGSITQQAEDKKVCPSCGMEVNISEKVCPICNYEFPGTTEIDGAKCVIRKPIKKVVRKSNEEKEEKRSEHIREIEKHLSQVVNIIVPEFMDPGTTAELLIVCKNVTDQELKDLVVDVSDLAYDFVVEGDTKFSRLKPGAELERRLKIRPKEERGVFPVKIVISCGGAKVEMEHTIKVGGTEIY